MQCETIQKGSCQAYKGLFSLFILFFGCMAVTMSRKFNRSLNTQSDEQLICQAQGGDRTAAGEIVRRYAPLARSKAAKFRSCFDAEDLSQEGMLALLTAIYSFDAAKSAASFAAYAAVCVNNRITSVIRTAVSKGKIPANLFVSLDDSILSPESGPEDAVIKQDAMADFTDLLHSALSSSQQTVLRLYLSGYTYREIAGKLSVTEKNVDNTLQTIKRRLKNMAD